MSNKKPEYTEWFDVDDAPEYVIYSDAEELFWSNDLGWCDLTDATRFTAEEKTWVRKPILADGNVFFVKVSGF